MKNHYLSKWAGHTHRQEIICYQISSYPNNKSNQSEYGDSDTRDI